jgi:hypothetical protein
MKKRKERRVFFKPQEVYGFMVSGISTSLI